jgi:hypothetical protein
VPGAEVGEALRGDTTFSPLALPFTVFSFFFGYSLGPGLRELHQPDRLAVLLRHVPLLAACALAAGGPLLAGLVRWTRRRWHVLPWIVVPLAAVVVLALRNIKPYNPRYVLVTLPFVLLLAAHGLRVLPRRLGLVWTGGLLALTLVALGGHYLDARYAKTDLRAAVARIAEASAAGQADPADPILVPVLASVVNYYHDGPGEVIGAWDADRIDDRDAARALVDAKLAGADAAWVVLARTRKLDPGGRLPAALAERGRLRLTARLPGVRILRWERYGPAAPVEAEGLR